MPSRRLLLLGGTGQAVELASLLVAAGFDVTTSLAGVTETPRLPPGKLLRGGFGGSEGLCRYLSEHQIELVVDATHAFARQISQNAAVAARQAEVPIMRLELPAWQADDNDNWTSVHSVSEAAAILPSGARVLLTIGRKEIAPFVSRADVSGLARMIEPPAQPLPSNWNLVLARPPFLTGDEVLLMRRNSISHLVSKNAGGAMTEAKLEAARRLSMPVVMIERPQKPKTEVLNSPQQVLKRIEQIFCS